MAITLKEIVRYAHHKARNDMAQILLVLALAVIVILADQLRQPSLTLLVTYNYLCPPVSLPRPAIPPPTLPPSSQKPELYQL